MSKKKVENEEPSGDVGTAPIQRPGSDEEVVMMPTEKNKFHKQDEEFTCSKQVSKVLIGKGLAKLVGMIALIFLSNLAIGQGFQGRELTFYNSLGTLLASDTATNTGVATVTTRRNPGGAATNTIVAIVTEISGTTGGTVTLQGSLDGSTWVTAGRDVAADSAAAFAYVTYPTKTPTDVTTAQKFTWVIQDSPFLYYRLSYAGTGIMSATISGKLMAH